MATKKHQANTQSTQHQSLINSGETFHPQGCDLFAETKQEERITLKYCGQSWFKCTGTLSPGGGWMDTIEIIIINGMKWMDAELMATTAQHSAKKRA